MQRFSMIKRPFRAANERPPRDLWSAGSTLGDRSGCGPTSRATAVTVGARDPVPGERMLKG